MRGDSVSRKKFYPVLLHKEDTGYSVSMPDFPGCFTQGENYAEAITMAGEAMELWVYAESKIPEPSDPNSIDVPEGSILVMVAI